MATVLMLTTLLAIITAVVAGNTLQSYKTTNWSSDAGTSRYIAYAGIQHAMIKLRNNPEFNETFQGKVPGRDGFTYVVTVSNQKNMKQPAQGSTDKATFRFNLTEIPMNCAKIESRVVLSENVDKSNKVERSISGMIGTAMFKPTQFKNAASARSTVLMTGDSKTRAYDFWAYKDDARENQSLDEWNGYINPDPGPGDKPEDKKDDNKDDHKMVKGSADVATALLMQIGDTSKVEGDVIMPELDEGRATTFSSDSDSGVTSAQVSSVDTARQSLSEIDPEIAQAMAGVGNEPQKDTNYTGNQRRPEATSAKKVAAPPYDRSEAVLELGNFPSTKKRDEWGNEYWEDQTLEPKAYKSIVVPAGQTLKLRPGRYYVSDNFKVNGEIKVDDRSRGDVIFYVGRTMEVNGRVNFQGDPAQLQIYFTDEDHKKDTNGDDILTDSKGNKVAGFSHLLMGQNSKATMVAQGTNLIAKMDAARLLGSVSGEAVWMKNKSFIEYDTNLADRQMAGASPWKLQGVYETVGK